jgi:hypothetical protein
MLFYNHPLSSLDITMYMYDKIRDEIKQDPYYQQNFPNDGQRFVAWYLRNVHNRDPNQAKYDMTDGEDDKQIDAIVVDENSSNIYIIQGKFVGVKKVDAEPLREVLSSWIQLKDLVRLQEVGNERLKRRLVDMGRALEDDYEVVFELITTATLTDQAKNDLGTFQEEIAKDEDLSASLVLVDEEELKTRVELALDKENPSIDYTVELQPNNYVSMKVAGTTAVVAALPLKECIKFPGIKDGTLFQKNVRQSLGLNNKVNKDIKSTIYSDRHKDFFFYHNGITAICNRLEIIGNKLSLRGVSVVNGCQSLNTILACSEKVKELDDTHILFRFYEIPQRDRADKISISTNFQTAVKPRDLRSNDKRVLNLKRIYEQKYPQGCLITKRGEEALPSKNKDYVIDLADLGKYLFSWHSKRPNIAYSETKLFDKYFEQLFRREYNAGNILALNLWMKEIMKHWVPANPLGLNESLLAMKAYAPYHQLYAVSQCFAIANNQPERVPKPSSTYENAQKFNVISDIATMAADCLNTALETAANEPQQGNRVFSPQNWIKSKSCLSAIDQAARIQLRMMMKQNTPNNKQIKDALTLSGEDFEYRWEGTD